MAENPGSKVAMTDAMKVVIGMLTAAFSFGGWSVALSYKIDSMDKFGTQHERDYHLAREKEAKRNERIQWEIARKVGVDVDKIADH